MNEARRVNTLNRGALTADDVVSGDHIICWQPDNPASTRRLTVVNHPYRDEDDNMVIDVKDTEGRVTTELTSRVGLTGDRYTGKWTVVAMPNEEVD